RWRSTRRRRAELDLFEAWVRRDSQGAPRPSRGRLRARDSERLGRGGDRVEVGAGVRAEAPEVEVGVVLDPAHRDLERLAIALLRLGALAPRQDVGELL